MKRVLILVLVFVPVLCFAQLQIKTGTYTGDTDTVNVSGVGFQPEFVLINTCGDNYECFIKTATMISNSSYDINAGTGYSDAIISIDADGFSLGLNADVNANGITHSYLCIKDDTDTYFNEGSYVGNATDNRHITGVGFQADMLMIKRGGTYPCYYATDASGGYTEYFSLAWGASLADLILTLEADGFEVSDNVRVNASSTTYYYMAFKDVANLIDISTYTGDGNDNRTITVGWQPNKVIVHCQGQDQVYHAYDRQDGYSDAAVIDVGGTRPNHIQDLVATGFEIGSSDSTNSSGDTFDYAAFKDGTYSAAAAKNVIIIK